MSTVLLCDNKQTISWLFRMSSDDSKKINQHNIDAILRSGLAGGFAGCAVSNLKFRFLVYMQETDVYDCHLKGKTVVAPLDRVKILFQTSNPDYKKYAGSCTPLFRPLPRVTANMIAGTSSFIDLAFVGNFYRNMERRIPCRETDLPAERSERLISGTFGDAVAYFPVCCYQVYGI